MDTVIQEKIAKEMFEFKKAIRFTTNDDGVKTVMAAINSNPKIVYFLHSCSISGVRNSYEITAQYIHKDTKLSDIHAVHSKEECMQYMRQFVGNYKKKLIIVAQKSVDIDNVREEFHEKHAPFFSNLTNVSILEYHAYGDYSVFEFDFTYRIGQVMLNTMELEVDAEVKRISELLFTPDMPVEVKVYLAHNYLASTTDYVDNDSNSLDLSYTQSAYGALIKHKCVCQGYAEAFKRIMDYNGIECDVVCGEIVGSDEYHAWNIISLGKGKGYTHIDVTWDSRRRKPHYLYFCKGDSFFEDKRIWNRKLNHKCSSSFTSLSSARRYVYINKNALLKKGIDPVILDC